MNWKTNIQVLDLDDNMRLECTCLSCGKVFYLFKAELIKNEGDEQLYLDEVETRLTCRQRGCKGKIEMLMIEPRKVSAWVGGMP